MCAKPGTAHIPVCPDRIALAKAPNRIAHCPYITIVAKCPALNTVECFCRYLTGMGHVPYKFHQWFMKFRKVGDFPKVIQIVSGK